MSDHAIFKQRFSPALRGSLFYSLYWGFVGIFQPFLFLYFSNLGLNSGQIGLLSSIFSLCVLVVTPLVARLADYLNRRTLLLAICVAGYAMVLLIFPIARNFYSLLFMFLLLNIFNAPIASLADSLVVRMSVHSHVNYGGMRLWGSLTFAIFSALFGLVWQQTGFGSMFLVGGILMFLVVGSALLLDENAHVHDPSQSQERSPALKPSASMLQDVPFLFILAAFFLIGAAFAIVWTFDSLFVAQLGGSNALIGGMRGLSALAELPPMQYSSRILRRLGDFKTLLLSLLLLALSDFGYWMAGPTWSILLVNIFKGLGYGLFFIAMIVIVDRRAPHGLSATYQGLTSAVAFGLAPTLVGPLGGWIYASISPRAVFLTAGLLILAAMLILIPAFIKRPMSVHSS